ncbi:HAD family hydrolase [Lachnospiraceae bacterium MD329]|nr:HAD family hydrolase [Lachnospiraceae bacterium MD329]
MRKISVCIFDLDGTLTDTIRAITHFGNMALEEFGMSGLSVEDYKIYVGDGRDKLIHRILSAHNADTPDLFEKVRDVYDAGYESDYLYDTNAYDGIKDVLYGLKQRGIKIAVCSNKPDNVVHFVTDNIFGKNYFDAVSGVIDGMPTKPNPHTALKIAEMFNAAPSECLFLGDTNVDIFTAKNAGMTSVGVLWGFRSREELTQAGADYIAEKPRDILQLLED